ncbi:MAG: VWA domain-containing protein, partial [Alphaproteobacteria bacterium]|nr:VWA domain-containing protein [Alphaproteobacteria bacterium]
EDAEPNRLGRAKTMIRALVDEIRKEGGHRLGLVAFAGRASLQSPLTLDYAFFLDRLEAAGPDSVPRKGSSIGGAIRQSLQRFGALDHDFTDLILVSDGEEHDSSALDAARLAAAEGVSLYAVAVGGADRGAPIPLPGADGQTDYLQHDGAEVRTRTRPALLVEIAGATGGSVSLNGDGALQRIYTQQIADKPRRQVAAATGERAAVQYHWFVVAALMLLALESLVRERARGQA